MLITRPPSRSTGPAFCSAKNGPFTLVAIIRSYSASVTSAIGVTMALAALHTRMSRPPVDSQAVSKTSDSAERSAWSACTATACPPASLTEATTSSAACSLDA
ncbi:hypothetical protein EV648_103198 [Kribbella sp. VKM Ac-2568]|nr:hypothetical protein EV648_103198 [Kribbella sp. VKM Ac-2568]